MQKRFLLLLLLLAVVVAWFVFSGDEPTLPAGPGQDPAQQEAPPDPGRVSNGGGASTTPDPSVGRSEVTGAGNDAAELAAGRAGEIRGRVLTPGGSPLPGASVVLFRREEDSAFSFGQDHNAPVDAKLTTDGEGWYRVRGLAAGSAWNVWAWHQDYAFAEGDAVEGFVGADQELPPITMGQGFVLEVKVVDMSNQPVAGARVEACLEDMIDTQGDAVDPLGRRFVVMSESDGFAGFEALGPGAWVLRAKKEGYGDGWLRPIILLPGREPGETRLLLGPEFGLRGSISSDRGPVDGAKITVETDPPGTGPSFHALSDAQGAFEIRGLPEGDFVLHAARHGFLASRPQEIRGTEAHDVRLEMQALGPVNGRLLGPDRTSARSGTIEIWRCIGGVPPYLPTQQIVKVEDPEGRFSIEFEGGGSYVLLARAEACAPTWSEVIQTRVDAVELGDWRLPAGARVHGMLVLGRQDAPLANALIKLMPRAWSPRGEEDVFFLVEPGSAEVPPMHVRSGADGSFEIPHLPLGSYMLSVEHPEAVTHALAVESTDGATRDLGQVRLQSASSLVVRAFDANGKPLAGGNLMLSTRENGLGQQNRLLDARGEALVLGLASGDYWVSAVEGGDLFGNVSRVKKIWLGPGERSEVELRLEN